MDDFLRTGSWKERLAHVTETMRRVSREDDPQRMVAVYRARLAEVSRMDGFLSVSRRGVEPPGYLIARSSIWESHPDPWRERDRLPVLRGGLIGDLFAAGVPRLIANLEVAPDDPAAEHFAGMRSLVSIPTFDQGEVFNLVIQMRKQSDGFERERFPEMVWLTNLFARATGSLFVSRRLREANERLERQAAEVARIQASLLPQGLPGIEGLELAVHYEASEKAGGDYYDFFRLSEGRWGILLADVSGHGTPAAVLMAITHTMAHLYSASRLCPAEFLAFLNEHLTHRYTRDSGACVTAFYGIYDPSNRQLNYALAGHFPPRVRRHSDGRLVVLPNAKRPPLGIMTGIEYDERILALGEGDELVFYTDGLTEAQSPDGEFFGEEGVDTVLTEGPPGAPAKLRELLARLATFAGTGDFEDDLTVVLARVR